MESQTLTPDDVSHARFATVKFRGGYDVQQVDDFLDHRVLPTLTQNAQLIDQLSARVTQLEAELTRQRLPIPDGESPISTG